MHVNLQYNLVDYYNYLLHDKNKRMNPIQGLVYL
jgi:hypothetical protein